MKLMQLHDMLATGLVAARAATAAEAWAWENVAIGGGGGFVDGIVFHPTEKGLAYARTDVGGLYRLNGADDSWTPITDGIGHDDQWHNWGIDALAIDPSNPDKVLAAVGFYTNEWDNHNGSIIVSSDRGATWSFASLPFKVGGGMPGRGTGERLAVDPANPSIVYFGARSGHGLWRSTDGAKSFSKVGSFTAVGTYVPDRSDGSGYGSDVQGLSFVTFDSASDRTGGGATSRIFVGTAVDSTSASVYVTTDAGATWTPVQNQPVGYIPHKAKLQPDEGALYLSYSDGTGPYDGSMGGVWRYGIEASEWTDITPANGTALSYGFGGLSVDLQRPGVVMVASLNCWWPDAQIFRSNDSGATWSPIWEWVWPDRKLRYSVAGAGAPWAHGASSLGSMIESLEIDPHDSDHWLYATGLTVRGGHDLTAWDQGGSVTLHVLAAGINAFTVSGLASPPNGTELLVSTTSVGGFAFPRLSDLTAAPSFVWDPSFPVSVASVDYAGNCPGLVARVGTGADADADAAATATAAANLALSTDGGASWAPSNSTAASGAAGGAVAVSADGDCLVWSTADAGVGSVAIRSGGVAGPFEVVNGLGQGALVVSDKRASGYFYAAAGSTFYVSSDCGRSFAPSGLVTAASSSADDASSSSSVLRPASIRALAAHPDARGTVFVSTDTGILRSTDGGASFAAFSPASSLNNTYSVSVGVGGQLGWTVYAFGTGPQGARLYASSDDGESWTDVQGDAQGFGAIDAATVAGSGNQEGVVYVGTQGRGALFAKPTLR